MLVVGGQKAVAVVKVVGEDHAVHASQGRIAYQGWTQTSLSAQDFSRVGDCMAIRLQGDGHLAQGAI